MFLEKDLPGLNKEKKLSIFCTEEEEIVRELHPFLFTLCFKIQSFHTHISTCFYISHARHSLLCHARVVPTS